MSATPKKTPPEAPARVGPKSKPRQPRGPISGRRSPQSISRKASVSRSKPEASAVQAEVNRQLGERGTRPARRAQDRMHDAGHANFSGHSKPLRGRHLRLHHRRERRKRPLIAGSASSAKSSSASRVIDGGEGPFTRDVRPRGPDRCARASRSSAIAIRATSRSALTLVADNFLMLVLRARGTAHRLAAERSRGAIGAHANQWPRGRARPFSHDPRPPVRGAGLPGQLPRLPRREIDVLDVGR